MDLIHKLLNIFLPPLTFILLLFFFPPFLVYNFFSSIYRSIKAENVAGKVILITGASSGIGEYLAYEYARRGARLGLVARREDRLKAVADKALRLGSPDVIVILADVSVVEDCKRVVDETVNHFGQLNHLVNNAGVIQVGSLDDSTQISSVRSLMDINFWGSVYCTQYGVPHLRKSKGKIVVISSVGTWYTPPGLSFYNASKAAQVCFFETLKAEFDSAIGITIVTPGLIESEMTGERFQSKFGISKGYMLSTEACAKAIVDSTCKGDLYLTEPSWYKVGFWFKLLFPQLSFKLSHSNMSVVRWTTNKND
ncbi:hypothetical protein UlMin_007640 [Ulmus minor]